jgi:hypothetical protein
MALLEPSAVWKRWKFDRQQLETFSAAGEPLHYDMTASDFESLSAK